MSVDAIAQIDALIDGHMREVKRLEIARSVMVEIVGNPNKVKQALMDRKNAETGFIVRRTGTPLIENNPAPPKTKAAKVKPKKPHASAGKLGKLGDFAIQVLESLKSADDGAPVNSDALALAMGFGPSADERKKLYNVLYTLKERGDVSKNGKTYSLTPQGKTTIAEAVMLKSAEAATTHIPETEAA